MRKIQFGCGGNKLEGWENYDAEVNIARPLPFSGAAIDFVFAEHVIEHVTHREAWNFLAECYRILKPGGVLRIAIPDVERIWSHFTPEYGAAVKSGCTRHDAVLAAVFNHGHQAAWTEGLLVTAMESVGFTIESFPPFGESDHDELKEVEGHWRVVGASVAMVETSIVEGVKQ